MNYSCASHIGKVRKNNEDYCKGEVIEVDNSKIGIFAIADGMGGHNKGEVASKLCVDSIIDYIKNNLIQMESVKIDYIDDIIKQAYNESNHIVYKKSKENFEYNGMGTTLTIAILYNDNLYVANVGDSRCYLKNKKEFIRVTTDHSVVEELIKANIITEIEAKSHPRRNHITRAMGTDEMVIVDIYKYQVEKNNIVLLATDGLTGFVEDSNINDIIKYEDDLLKISENLIKAANDASGKDNISVILIKNN